MNYKILASATPNIITLKQTRALSIVLSVIFYLMAFLFIPVGLLQLLIGSSGIPFAFAFLSMGLLFLTGGILINTRRAPEFFAFNNSKGQLTVKERRRGGKEFEAVIPYSEIAGIELNTYRGNSNETHAVEMKKRDGSVWGFYSSVGRGRATKFRDEIVRRLDLSVPGEAPKYDLPANIKCERAAGSTIISWRPKYGIIYSFVCWMGIASVVTLIGSFWKGNSGEMLYLGAFGVILGFVVVGVFSALFSIGRSYFIKIDRQALVHYSTGLIKRRYFSVPITEIESVNFNFSINEGNFYIYIFKKGELEIFDRIRHGMVGLGDIPKMVSFLRRINKINFGNLSIVEKLGVERALQEAIVKWGGKKEL